jgi:hypothetical protein
MHSSVCPLLIKKDSPLALGSSITQHHQLEPYVNADMLFYNLGFALKINYAWLVMFKHQNYSRYSVVFSWGMGVLIT